MLFYILWFGALVILFLFSDSVRSGPYKKLFRWLGLLIAIIVSAFRYNVGKDYFSYRNSIINLDSNYHNSEPLNKALFYFSHWIGLPQFYFIITTLIIFLLVHSTVKKYSNYYTLSFLIFLSFPLFFANSLTIIRQFIAMSVIFYSVKYILYERNFFKFLFLVVLASGFHYSAVAAIPIFFLNKAKIKSWTYILFFSFPIVFKRLLIYIIVNYAPSYSKYVVYKYGLNAGGGKAIYLFLVVCCYLLLFKKNIIAVSEKNRLYLNSIILGSIIYWSLLDFGHVGMRLASFYLMFCIILLPNTIKIVVKGNRKIVVYGAYLFCFLVFLVTFGVGLKNGESSYIPYKFIFQK